MSNLFGWSYPPGCSGTPFDENHPCELCGLFEGDCICPECPKCGERGDPRCYQDCGLVLNNAQIESLKKQEAKWAKDSAAAWEAENQQPTEDWV